MVAYETLKFLKEKYSYSRINWIITFDNYPLAEYMIRQYGSGYTHAVLRRSCQSLFSNIQNPTTQHRKEVH